MIRLRIGVPPDIKQEQRPAASTTELSGRRPQRIARDIAPSPLKQAFEPQNKYAERLIRPYSTAQFREINVLRGADPDSARLLRNRRFGSHRLGRTGCVGR